MGVAVIVGTEKGAAILRADDAREVWTVDALQLPGWIVTASTRDARGRFYVGVTSDVYGVTILTSEDLEAWEPVAEPPRYTPADRGNSEHNRIIRASDPQGRMQAEQRHVDQIWRLHAAGDVLYAGVSEAGPFRSVDRGASWEALRGLSDHPSREAWVPGFGGLCAHAVLVDGGNPDRLWVGISAAGLFRSDDGGESWTAKNAGIAPGDDGEPGAEPIEAYCVHGLAHVPADPDVIYRQDHRGMYLTRRRRQLAVDRGRSTDRGAERGATMRLRIPHRLRPGQRLGLRGAADRRQLPLPAGRPAAGLPHAGPGGELGAERLRPARRLLRERAARRAGGR